MPDSGRVIKRILLGRAMRSDKLSETLLPKRLALPIFASDALSSVAYAPDEILLTLGLAGGAFAMTHSWQIALAVVFVMVITVMSYRQNVHAYPSGGGDYEVATVNLGPKAGLTVASALLVDYVLTVAVSISSGVQNARGALPFLRGHEMPVAVGLVVLLTALNLRGVRESGRAFAVPVYLFMLGVIGMAAVGFSRHLFGGGLPEAASAAYELRPEAHYEGLAGIAMVFLLMRAFSSGCAALTGVEAISNGVPAFQKPKSRNAATTLLLMGTISVTMLLSIITLSRITNIKYAENPDEQLFLNGEHVEGYHQETVISQLAGTVFKDFPLGLIFVSTVTGVILVLAANTAFNGFPVLASILARDGYMPRQMHTRGDRLAFSNGIIFLAAAAIALIIVADAQVTVLINLYIVGVFVSFTLSQTGMIRHWNRHLRTETDSAARRTMRFSRVINGIGATMAVSVLIIVLLTKFALGAKYAIAAMVILFVVMTAIRKHYDHVAKEIAVAEADATVSVLPSRVHAIVLVSKIHKPAMRALTYARASRPSTLEAVTVDVDSEETRALMREWDERNIPVPLKVLSSPFREITRPVLDYVKSLRSDNPRDIVTVYIPEYVLGHWWEQILHNQSALRLKARLLFTPGVMNVSVPWQLSSSEGQEQSWYDGPVASLRGPAE